MLLAATVFTVGFFSRMKRRFRERQVTKIGVFSMSCPICHRVYSAGSIFCPRDAQRLLPMSAIKAAGEATLGKAAEVAVQCVRCERLYPADTRFCPHDAELLEPRPTAIDSHVINRYPHQLIGHDKICPECAAKYGLAASYCGKDGSALMIVN